MATTVPKYEKWLTKESIVALSEELADPPELARMRLEAYDRFLTLPLEPNPLYRGYGYFANVDLAGIDPIQKGPPVPTGRPPDSTIQIVHDASGTRAELPESLRAAGVSVRTLAEFGAPSAAPGSRSTLTEEAPDRLSALASALVNRGYRLEVPDGWTEPVHLEEFTVLSVPHEALSVYRSIRAGTDAQLLATEQTFSSPGPPGAQRLYASTTDLELGPRSKVVFLSLHAPDDRTVSIYRRNASTSERSRLAWMWNGLGGFRTKVRNRTTLAGDHSAVDDLQMFFGSGDQSYDSSVDLTHTGTNTHGQSITRGVFRDQARGMSRGLVRIEHEARKTVSFISEHAMLLSKGARSDTIPILEILCRDVKATHSTSVAPVDPEKVFYLRTRGMDEPESIRMIGEGFLAYVLERSPIAGLREILLPALEKRWDGEELSWTGHGPPALPPLHVSGTETAPEWRFDSKLR